MIKDRSDAIPKLRFPEYEKPWELRRGSEYFSSSRKKGEDGLPIYSVTQADGLVRRDSLDRQIGKDAGAEKNLRAAKDDLVYNMMRMWQGAVGIANEECMVSPAYVVLHPKKTANSNFFLYHFDRARSLYLLWAYSYGLTNDRLRLYYKDFAFIEFSAPCPKEQKKIALFLGSVDKKISQLEKKRDLLGQYKKGVMQQIFSQEIRFKDDNGNDFPNWGEKRLGRCVDLQSGFAFGSKFFGTTGQKLVTPKNFTKNGYGLFKTANTKLTMEDVDSKYICSSGDLLVLLTDLTPSCALLGKPLLVTDSDGDVLLNQRIVRLNPDPKLIAIRYLQCFLLTQKYHRRIKSTATGSTVRHTSNKILKSVFIPLPKLEEQHRIANFLSAIDERINLVGQQVTRMRDFKTALLQQMFV